MNTKNIKATIVEIEPGDKTKYSFIISNVDDYILIAGTGEGAMFQGYSYDKISIKEFCKKYEYSNIGYNEYQKWVSDNKILEEGYLGYIVNHSHCNVWTALIAVFCMNEVIKENENG